MTNHNDKLVAKALRVAAKAHQGDVRKVKGAPYIVHPVEAAMTLQRYGMGDEVIAAGLLHDTLEDTDLTAQDLRDLFNDKVAELVLGASEKLRDRKNTSWEERKQNTIDYLKSAPQEIKYIACADKLSNVSGLLRDYQELGEELWANFNRGYEKQKWYYESLVDSLESLAGQAIYKDFKSVVKSLFAK